MSSTFYLPLYLAFISLLVLLLNLSDVLLVHANGESKVHVVYLGRRKHDDVELTTSAHHQILSSVLGSQEAARESIIYSYRHGFSGFAAKLTKAQAKRIAELPDVVHVVPSHFYQLHTTRSWDYLGLSTSSPPTNLLHQANMGDGIIIGVLDTGIWPESEAFNDKGLGPIPSRWKGHCQSGEKFDPAMACNRKLIGAKYFAKGYEASLGGKFDHKTEVASPRDRNGHGTHTSTTAGGSFAPNASYHGLAYGTVRGGAPKARLAMYKVCYNGGGCHFADVIMAIDQAIHDGVDILSMSLGAEPPLVPDVDFTDGGQFASLHAVMHGITVVCSAGNKGSLPQTVGNISPWMLTVAASSIDRSLPTLITLGNNQAFVGQSLYTGKETAFLNIAYHGDTDTENRRYCDNFTPNDTSVAGKVGLCFLQGDELNLSLIIEVFRQNGGLGLIVAKSPSRALEVLTFDFPSVGVSYDVGTQILNYFRDSGKPRIKLSPAKTHVGKPISTYVASFSSRGPNSIAPAILKPDVAAPGVLILAAVAGEFPYEFESGTSMAAPHVSGISALLKSLHPDWSPAAIKSAIMTTAGVKDPHSGLPIIAEGMPFKVADPFDFGSGLVNAHAANDPGLIYDMGAFDYILYLCSMGYKNSDISNIIDGGAASCPIKRPSILDVNLPSLTIPSLKGTVNVRRTVTNVGPENSKYEAIIEPPPGITIKVKPDTLIFNSDTEQISFTLTISPTHEYNTAFEFGSLTWTDGVHQVRIPISVRTEFAQLD
ncbi:Subtilisin-like protease SBT3.5 [Capsicum annuum]|uniref:subtilisin-like protease SBT3.8 isoform X1 n=2 Tax=Capsicum annuum TaxID=4072 RepID=UPI001FB0B402|nr:subtilisin-like protease SBT3.8 isoform X1 [Capsicum annuum]KAF3677154.1 Subtilisin-like protease SBT3.5 [Capsicum annuum]